jgi:hypothetical protein
MGTDLNKDYKDIKSKIQAYQTTNESKKDLSQIIKDNLGDNFEESKKNYFSNLNEWGETVDGMTQQKKKQMQDVAKTQLDQLTEIFMVSVKSADGTIGSLNSVDKLIDIYNDTILGTKDRIREIFIKETISSLGCSEEQTFSTSPIYLRVQSVDLYKKLLNNPNGGTESLLFESETTPNGTIPYSMNKELYNRVQNLGISFSQEYGNQYQGASKNGIMNITYVDQDNNGNLGDYLKIDLQNNPNNVNSVTQFLTDYYTSINMIDIDELITVIMDNLTNAVSFDLGVDINFKEQESKFMRLLQRILGLCFDTTKEIDVSGIAKVSALDNVDESFFDFTNAELRNIESKLEDYVKGVVEFTDCNNVKLPMDNQAVINYIQESRDETTEKNKLGKMVQSLEKLSENEEWKLKIPSININAAIKFDLLGIIPKSIMQILLSPKNLLGFMTMFKAIQNNIVDLIEDLEDFFLTFKSFLIEMMSKIGSIFVEELFKNIKANLSQLVRLIITDISKESRDATTKMIFTVLETVIILADGFLDWRQCKSVVDELFKLLQIAGRNLDLGLPSFALSLSRFLPGMSETRVYANYIEELQKNGIPTGDLPDGSPNIALQSNLSMIKGQFKEMHENGKTEVTLDPISIIGGSTTGSVKMYGKSY